MKVLLSAYACEPGKGSEPEVGLQAMLAAATLHEVWVLTRSNNVPVLTDFLRSHMSRDRIHLVGTEAPHAALFLKRTGLLPVQLYYDLWQRSAERIAQRLEREVGFDVMHHVTFASYWSRTGVAAIDLPLVWGPIGGAVEVPDGFHRLLGPRGVIGEVARAAIRHVAASVNSPTRARSAPILALVQNRETAEKLSGFADVRVVSNATAVSLAPTVIDGVRTKEVACVGRLIPWKGGKLAVQVMAHVADRDATLVFYGEGREMKRIDKLARKRGVTVQFAGSVPREQLLESIGRSSVLLHTSLREEAGLAVAEALSLGTPVVCLDHGGPSELVSRWTAAPSVAVSPTSSVEAGRQLAAAVDGFLASPAPRRQVPFQPQPSFRQEVLQAYEDVLVER